MTNSKSLLGSRARGPEPSQQSKQEHLLRVVRKRWGNDRKHTRPLAQFQKSCLLTRRANVSRHFAGRLMPAQESHRTPCSVQTACEGAATPLSGESCVIPADRKQGSWFSSSAELLPRTTVAGTSCQGMCSSAWQGPAEALKGFPLFPPPQPLGKVLADGQEGVGSVLGIGDNLVKPSHFLPSEERKITQQFSKCLV